MTMTGVTSCGRRRPRQLNEGEEAESRGFPSCRFTVSTNHTVLRQEGKEIDFNANSDLVFHRILCIFRGASGEECATAGTLTAAAEVQPPSAPSTARSVLRTPRTSRQHQQQQHQQQQQQQQLLLLRHDTASAGAALRQRLMQFMADDERALLLKTLSAS
jgi:hypothetical protein